MNKGKPPFEVAFLVFSHNFSSFYSQVLTVLEWDNHG